MKEYKKFGGNWMTGGKDDVSSWPVKTGNHDAHLVKFSEWVYQITGFIHADCHLCQSCNRYQGWICATKSSAMVTGCLFLVMLAFLLSICTFLTWQNCCKGRYQWKKTLHPDTAIAKLGFGKIRVTKVRQLSRTGWSHLLPVWDDSGPGSAQSQVRWPCPPVIIYSLAFDGIECYLDRRSF